MTMLVNDEILKLSSKIDFHMPIQQSLLNEVKRLIDRSGMFYRSFIRVKSPESTYLKLQNAKYCETKKIQDLIGIRIVMYFKDDVDLCRKIIERGFCVNGISEDKNNQETFKPTRLNIVCNIPDDILDLIESSVFSDYFIDKTFEIQLRTVFSEGWHEVDHDLRYKFSNEWSGEYIDYSRAMNGIFATLETCDRAVLDLLNNFSYEKYKKRSWDAMIRNKLRIRLSTDGMSSQLKSIMDSDQQLAKSFFVFNREDLLERLAFDTIGSLPKNINNMIYIINALFVKNHEIKKLTPERIIQLCSEGCRSK